MQPNNAGQLPLPEVRGLQGSTSHVDIAGQNG